MVVTMAHANANDGQAPSVASNLSVTDRTASSLTVAWDAASDAGGSGLDRYVVTIDGEVEETVDASTTSATISGLSADASYDVGVTAFDAANNESLTDVVSASTRPAGSDGSGTGTGSGGDTGSGTGGETGSGTGADSGTGSGGDTGSGSGGETGTGSDTGTGSTDGASDDSGTGDGSGSSGWWDSGDGSGDGGWWGSSGDGSDGGWWSSSGDDGSDDSSDSGGWW